MWITQITIKNLTQCAHRQINKYRDNTRVKMPTTVVKNTWDDHINPVRASTQTKSWKIRHCLVFVAVDILYFLSTMTKQTLWCVSWLVIKLERNSVRSAHWCSWFPWYRERRYVWSAAWGWKGSCWGGGRPRSSRGSHGWGCFGGRRPLQEVQCVSVKVKTNQTMIYGGLILYSNFTVHNTMYMII